ncbi:MAG: hypothetical protein KKB21_02595 [Nanoarchaeota archaeon]|nr:hypothetical protein [Nanoarchaeota archaeon]MBU4086444.1 hypothetical protein [Nanoarchaeota archaeon]
MASEFEGRDMGVEGRVAGIKEVERSRFGLHVLSDECVDNLCGGRKARTVFPFYFDGKRLNIPDPGYTPGGQA